MSGKQKHPKNKEKSWIRLVAEPQLENEIDEMETAVEDHANPRGAAGTRSGGIGRSGLSR